MKIGILTLRLFKNYGGILQNYALSRFLQKNGYDVETINIVWSYQLNGVKKYFVWLKRLVRNMLIGKWYSLDEEKILRNNELVAAQRVNAFKEKNIPLSQKVYSLPGADFSDISNKYDTIIRHIRAGLGNPTSAERRQLLYDALVSNNIDCA